MGIVTVPYHCLSCFPFAMLITTVLDVAALFHVATCAPWTASPVRPSVRLDDTTFIGSRENMTEAYLGIKYAEAP